MINPDEAFVLPPLGALFDTPTIPDLGALLKVALSPATAAPELDMPSFDIDLDDPADHDTNASNVADVAGFDFDDISDIAHTADTAEPADFIDLGVDEPLEQLPDDIDFNDTELGEFDDHPEGL